MDKYNLGVDEQELLALEELGRWSENTYSQPVKGIGRIHGGLTNHTYLATLSGGQELIFRVGGTSTTKYLDRRIEQENSKWASEKGFGPEVIYFDATTGNSIVRNIEGETLGENSFSNSKILLEKGIQLARYLHTDGPVFSNRVDPFKDIQFYEKVTRDTGYTKELLGWAEVKDSLVSLEPIYNKDLDLVACHNDLLPQNFIWDEKKLWLIDWEHSGNNDRYFDLGGFSLENGFTPQQEIELLTLYWEAPPTLYQQARLQLSKVLVGALWGAWAVMLVALGKDEGFYWDYGQGRLDESKRQLSNPQYKEWLETLSQGETGVK